MAARVGHLKGISVDAVLEAEDSLHTAEVASGGREAVLVGAVVGRVVLKAVLAPPAVRSELIGVGRGGGLGVAGDDFEVLGVWNLGFA